VSDDDDNPLVPITVKHDDLVEYLKVSAAVIDNPQRPDWFRADAREFYDQCSRAMLYENDPARRVRLKPMSFHVRGFYASMVVELLDRLPELKDEQPIRVQMARQSAELVDNRDYSIDYRLDALKSLKAVLESLEPAGLTVVT
jgi:hypothetical protein